jgi:hemerythrin superfamily protein
MPTQTSLTATELLRQRHEEVKTLFDQTIAAEGERRAELFDCLRATLAVHETVEEMFVHPLARSISDAADTVVLERLAEESEAKDALANLEKLTTEGDGWSAAFLDFKKAVLRHAEAEERELFPLLDANCNADVRRQLADNILASEPLAPTHPHPHAGENPLALMLVGPFASMLDHARDKIKELTHR